MISDKENSTVSSVNEDIKDIISSSYTQDELLHALLFSDLLEEVLSPIDVQAMEDRSTEIKIRDAYVDYRNGKTDIVDMDKNSAHELLERFGEDLTGPDDEGLFLIDEEDGMFTAIDNTTGDCWTENFPSRELAVAYLSGFEFDFLEDYTKRHPVASVDTHQSNESLDEMMAQKVDVAENDELGEHLGVSNGER